MLIGRPEALLILERMESALFLLRSRRDKALEAVRHALVPFGPDAVLTAAREAYRPLAANLMHAAGQRLDPAKAALTRLVLRGPAPEGRIRDLFSSAMRRAGEDLARALTPADPATA